MEDWEKGKKHYLQVPLANVVLGFNPREFNPEDDTSTNGELSDKALLESLRFIGQTEPAPAIRSATGEIHLRGGYRRYGALRHLKKKSIDVLAVDGDPFDKMAAFHSLSSNSRKNLSWCEFALQIEQSEKEGATLEEIKKVTGVSKSHLQNVKRAKKKISGLVQDHVLPDNAIHELGEKAAIEIAGMEKEEIPKAYNSYMRTGKLPARKSESATGRKPRQGLRKGESFSLVSELAKMQDRNSEIVSSELALLFSSIPCRTAEDLAIAAAVICGDFGVIYDGDSENFSPSFIRTYLKKAESLFPKEEAEEGAPH